MEQSSILSAKCDCPVARQNISLLAAAHDCETGLFYNKQIFQMFSLFMLCPRDVDVQCGQRIMGFLS